MIQHDFSDTVPEIVRLAESSVEGYKIDPALYTQYDVKRGLRDINGNGVVAGLTNVSTIKVLDTGEEPNHGDGKLYYRGIDVEDIVAGFIKESASDSRRPYIFFCSEICLPSMSLRSSERYLLNTVHFRRHSPVTLS